MTVPVARVGVLAGVTAQRERRIERLCRGDETRPVRIRGITQWGEIFDGEGYRLLTHQGRIEQFRMGSRR